MNLLRLGIIAVAMLASASGHAASCNVKELADIGKSVGGIPMQIALEPPLADQLVTTTGGVSPSAQFQAGTKFIEIICDTQSAYLIGTAPVAATSNSWVPAGVAKVIAVTSGKNYKISFIQRP